MSDLTHAADTIDQLADALPDHLRLPRWHIDRDRIVTLDAAGDPDLIVADQHGIHDGEAVVRLLHALASPDRARAVAALLRAYDEAREALRDLVGPRHPAFTTVDYAMDDLARLYLGSSDA